MPFGGPLAPLCSQEKSDKVIHSQVYETQCFTDIPSRGACFLGLIQVWGAVISEQPSLFCASQVSYVVTLGSPSPKTQPPNIVACVRGPP